MQVRVCQGVHSDVWSGLAWPGLAWPVMCMCTMTAQTRPERTTVTSVAKSELRAPAPVKRRARSGAAAAPHAAAASPFAGRSGSSRGSAIVIVAAMTAADSPNAAPAPYECQTLPNIVLAAMAVTAMSV